jgi:hypothetical protein
MKVVSECEAYFMVIICDHCKLDVGEKKCDVQNKESPIQIDEYGKIITFFDTLFCTFVDNLCLFDS